MAVSPFVDASGKKSQCYYPHRLRDSVFPVCGIFFTSFLTASNHLCLWQRPNINVLKWHLILISCVKIQFCTCNICIACLLYVSHMVIPVAALWKPCFTLLTIVYFLSSINYNMLMEYIVFQNFCSTFSSYWTHSWPLPDDWPHTWLPPHGGGHCPNL